MSMHTRKPCKLDYKTYLTWMREFVKWLTAHAGDSDYPSHIVPSIADFEDLIDQFESILGPYENLITLANAKNKLYTAAFENLSDKLVQIKMALVTIAEDPDILALFDPLPRSTALSSFPSFHSSSCGTPLPSKLRFD